MDQIVYFVVSKPGGVDGRDGSDQGGQVLYASFDKDIAQKHCNAWSRVEPRVIDLVQAKQEALKKLDPLDRLILKI